MIIFILYLHIKPSIISILDMYCLKARYILAAHSCMRMNLSSYSLNSCSLYSYSILSCSSRSCSKRSCSKRSCSNRSYSLRSCSLYCLSYSYLRFSLSILRYCSSHSLYYRSRSSCSRISYSYISICLILSSSYYFSKYSLKVL